MREIVKSVGKLESIETLEILQHQRAVRDQSQLNSQQRSTNITGAFTALNK